MKPWILSTHAVGTSERIVDSRYRWHWTASLRVRLGGRRKALRLTPSVYRDPEA